MNINIIKNKKLGRICYLINNKIKLGITLDVGPRIIYCSYKNSKNVLWEDTNNNFTYSHKLFNKEIWKSYGGHRIWVSPETYLTYNPDNQPVNFKKENNWYVFSSNKQKLTGLILGFKIKLEENKINIIHFIKNNGKKTYKNIAPWAITGLKAKSKVIYNFDKLDNGFLPNRNLSLWTYTNINDQRFDLDNNGFTLSMNPNNKQAFKIGTLSKHASVNCKIDKVNLNIKFEYDKNKNYPDYNCNLETYTNNHFIEVETLGCLQDLKPNKIIFHSQEWTF